MGSSNSEAELYKWIKVYDACTNVANNSELYSDTYSIISGHIKNINTLGTDLSNKMSGVDISDLKNNISKISSKDLSKQDLIILASIITGDFDLVHYVSENGLNKTASALTPILKVFPYIGVIIAGYVLTNEILTVLNLIYSFSAKALKDPSMALAAFYPELAASRVRASDPDEMLTLANFLIISKEIRKEFSDVYWAVIDEFQEVIFTILDSITSATTLATIGGGAPLFLASVSSSIAVSYFVSAEKAMSRKNAGNIYNKLILGIKEVSRDAIDEITISSEEDFGGVDNVVSN